MQCEKEIFQFFLSICLDRSPVSDAIMTISNSDKEITMAFDYKKEYREFYLPKNTPSIVTVPPMNYVAVRGTGDPNAEDSEYMQSIPLLYGIAYTIKMSYKGDHGISGYFDYVVPPLEGFWQQDGIDGMDYSRKDLFRLISVIRLPDFVS